MENSNRSEAAAGRYRADIDGLRAVAVLPVVFYHFDVPPFTGGFVGVDVFFVISGFLITSLIWGEMRERRFSIINFYERRIRRILPALFAVIAATTVAALVVLFPRTLVRYAISMLATGGFFSNIQFWSEAGYWDAGSTEKPLLHTWSLAVEEQFYLLFPWLLYALRQRSRAVVLAITVATLLASLLASVIGVMHWPVTTFYLLPMRFWELLLGAVLALGRFESPENPVLRNALSAAGLGLIAWSVFTLTPSSPFPGVNAIAPCLGAALIILAGTGKTTLVNTALSARLPVFIGLISYSLYLWHWPINVLALAVVPGELSPLVTVLCILGSLLLATLSWRFVEQPFRKSSNAIGRKSVFVAAGAAIGVTSLVATVLWVGAGFPQRYNPEVRRILAEADDAEPLRVHCFNFSGSKLERHGPCRFGSAHAAPSVLVWGDSHADATLPAVWKAASAKGLAGYIAAHGHCAPLVGVIFPLAQECGPFNEAAFKIAQRPEIRTVVLVAKWAPFAGEPRLKGDGGDFGIVQDAQSKEVSARETRAAFARGVERTVRLLRAGGKNVILVAATPEFREQVPVELAKMKVWGGSWEIAPTRNEFLARQRYANSVFAKVERSYGIVIVHPDSVLCARAVCLTTRDRRPLYRDYSHLSVFGAEQLSPLFDRIL